MEIRKNRLCWLLALLLAALLVLCGVGTAAASAEESELYTFDVHWNMASATAADGADYTYSSGSTMLSWNPVRSDPTMSSNVLLTFRTQLAEGQKLPAGAIEIRVPRWIFKTWDDVPVLLIDGFKLTPEGTENEHGFWYTIDGDDYVITNYKEMGSNTLTMQYAYYADAMLINGGRPDDNYATHYVNNSINFSAKVTLNDIVAWTKSYTLQTEVQTKVDAGIKSASANPGATGYGLYLTWDSSWGTKPADADDYFYIMWHVNYTRNDRKSTQPWKEHLTDPAGGGEIIGTSYYKFYNRNTKPSMTNISGNNMDSSGDGTVWLTEGGYAYKNTTKSDVIKKTMEDDYQYTSADGDPYYGWLWQYGNIYYPNNLQSGISGGYGDSYTVTNYAVLMRYPKSMLAENYDAATSTVTIKDKIGWENLWKSGYLEDGEYPVEYSFTLNLDSGDAPGKNEIFNIQDNWDVPFSVASIPALKAGDPSTLTNANRVASPEYGGSTHKITMTSWPRDNVTWDAEKDQAVVTPVTITMEEAEVYMNTSFTDNGNTMTEGEKLVPGEDYTFSGIAFAGLEEYAMTATAVTIDG